MLVLGVVILTLLFIPYFVLKGESYFLMLDQLDDGVIKAVLRARHFFDADSGYMPELLGGVDIRNSCSITVLLFLLFKPMTALVINIWIVSVFAFCGMYLLLVRLTDHQVISFLTAGIFSILPFYATFGLSVMGIPFVLYAFINLYSNEKIVPSLILVGVYSYFSSFILSGFVICGAALILLIWIAVHREVGEKKFCVIGIAMMYGIFAFNISDLIVQFFLSDSGEASHRTEMAWKGFPFWSNLKSLLLVGYKHYLTRHQFILPLAVALSILGLFRRRRVEGRLKKEYTLLMVSFALILAVTFFAAGINCQTVMVLRNQHTGLLQSFHFERVESLYPTLWYLILGAAACIALDEGKLLAAAAGGRKKFWRNAGTIAAAVIILLNGGHVFHYSTYYKNFAQMTGFRHMHYVSWDDFYAEDLFHRIDKYIGRDKSTYRVASLGIHPAAALYNGFYCIDGYATSYPLAYKHKFRRIIARELEKNEAVRHYFDDWGNRCYIFSAELGSKYDHAVIAKDSALSPVRHLEIDTGQMKKLGAEYLISAVEIKNYRETGLKLEKVFESPQSYYRLYLYSL